jgi:hypothetical protein
MRRAAVRLALLAFPRAFRRHFGDEMLADSLRTDARRALPRTLSTLIWNGLAERRASIARMLFWPNHTPHLYHPSGRHAMFWDTLRSDLQHAWRLALKTPMVTALTVLALALGIGATSAIFAVVDGVLLKPLPYTQSERLVNLWSDATRQGRPRNTLSPANFKDFQQSTKTLEGLTGPLSGPRSGPDSWPPTAE